LFQGLPKNLLFEVISLHGPTGLLLYQFFLEGFFRDIPMNILGKSSGDIAESYSRLPVYIDQ